MPIKLKIDVTKLDKSAFFHGKNGAVYVDLVMWETPDSQYGDDYRVNQDMPKERRDAGEKGKIVGNGKNFGDSKRVENRPQSQGGTRPPIKRPPADPNLDPDDDGSGIPF